MSFLDHIILLQPKLYQFQSFLNSVTSLYNNSIPNIPYQYKSLNFTLLSNLFRKSFEITGPLIEMYRRNFIEVTLRFPDSHMLVLQPHNLEVPGLFRAALDSI